MLARSGNPPHRPRECGEATATPSRGLPKLPCLAVSEIQSARPATVTRRLAIAVFVALAVPAGAQAPPSALRMTCADAIALVKRDGAVAMASAPGKTERFVRDRGQCGMTEIAELRFVPTRDNLECPVGYRCREPDYGDWDWP